MKTKMAYMANVEVDRLEHSDDPNKKPKVHRDRVLGIVFGPDNAEKSISEYVLRHKQFAGRNPRLLGLSVYPALGSVNFVDHNTQL